MHLTSLHAFPVNAHSNSIRVLLRASVAQSAALQKGHSSMLTRGKTFFLSNDYDEISVLGIDAIGHLQLVPRSGTRGSIRPLPQTPSRRTVPLCHAQEELRLARVAIGYTDRLQSRQTLMTASGKSARVTAPLGMATLSSSVSLALPELQRPPLPGEGGASSRNSFRTCLSSLLSSPLLSSSLPAREEREHFLNSTETLTMKLPVEGRGGGGNWQGGEVSLWH
jgi:hypothetical protein